MTRISVTQLRVLLEGYEVPGNLWVDALRGAE